MITVHLNAPPKKIFEPANREELLRGWLLHAHKGRDRHDLAARRNDTYRYWLDVPTIVFAAVVGTSVFATLESQVDTNFKIGPGFVSIASAVLASLQTFYDFATHAASHRLAGVKYKTIIRELEQILTGPAKQLPEKAVFLTIFVNAWMTWNWRLRWFRKPYTDALRTVMNMSSSWRELLH